MKEKYEYRKATIEDIDELVRTRIIVLRVANKLSDDVDMSVVQQESCAYYKRALETGEHIAYLVHRIIINWHIRLSDCPYTSLSSIAVAHYGSFLRLAYEQSSCVNVPEIIYSVY